MSKSTTSSRMFLSFYCFLFVAWLLPSPDVLAKEPLIKVERVIWTDGVENREYQRVYQETAPSGPLYIWMRVVGTESALRELEKRGKLPIHHQWILHSYVGASYQGVTDMVKLKIGNPELIDKLNSEISTKKSFDWRTWSMKENIWPGTWEVKVLYNNYEAVLDEDNKPCKYTIEVR